MSYRPRFRITASLLRKLEEISSLRQKILSATDNEPRRSWLIKEARVRIAHSSVSMEGNPLALEEVRALDEGRNILGVGGRARKEMKNELAALRFVAKHQDKKEITCPDLLRLHKILASGILASGKAGKRRTFSVQVGSYVPPPAKELAGLMREYLKWWNQKAQEWSPVISSAILHHRFDVIHPFAGVNGRMGRAVALWELWRRGFDVHHLFSFDEIYSENRERYCAELEAARKSRGDLVQWLEYGADVFQRTLERVWKRVEFLHTRQVAGEMVFTPRQEKLLALLRARGGLAPKEIWSELRVTKQGAAKMLNPLLHAGVLRRIGTRKSGRYVLR